jgi:hypothetical protein
MEALRFEGHYEVPRSALEGSRLFANRLDLISSLPEGGSWLEIGVAYGDLSSFIIQKKLPRVFVGVDMFGWETLTEVWGQPVEKTLGKKSHEVFYRDRLSQLGREYRVETKCVRGISWDVTSSLPDTFDYIYIDAGHDYESVRKDTEAAIPKMNKNGVLIFNDYTWRDNVNGEIYGIVPVVNQLLQSGEWNVYALALQPLMFMDIALTRVEHE